MITLVCSLCGYKEKASPIYEGEICPNCKKGTLRKGTEVKLISGDQLVQLLKGETT